MIARLLAYFRPQPLHWTRREMLWMRLGLALVIYALGVHWSLAPFTPEPSKLNGLAKWVPLTWILKPTVMMALRVLTALSLALFVVGIIPVLSLLPALLAVCGTGALRNSKGDISHTTQAIAMSLVALWLAYLIAALWKQNWKRADAAAQRWALLAALLIFSASYVASGLVKLKVTRGQWIANVPNMAVQIMKSNLSDYYSKPVGRVDQTMTETAPQLLTQHPTAAKLLFGSGLVLELGAFLMLLGRRWAALWGGALLAMHLGISWLMGIEFWSHLGLLTVLCVLPAIPFKRGKENDITAA